ncbi:MAG TPA: acetyl ornithine aminotransferase family protein [Anaerolineales bacterium]|nr:acetyl ornithine aminotransferase family protein [Anaerolineales bacterium]
MVQKLSVPGPNAQAILKRDAATISPSYPRDYPFVMSHGKGTEVWDVDGNRYLDFAAGIAVCSTGHSHPDVVRAIQQQAEKFIHISSDFYHEKWVQLGEKLDEIAPFKEDALCFMTNSGAEAVEAAIKLARFHTRRPRFIGFHGGFHGRTMGALAFTASKATQRRGFSLGMPGVTHVPFPNPYRQRFAYDPNKGDYGDAVIEYIENHIFVYECPPEDVAGFLVEPIQGEGGYVIPPDSFFPRLRALCDKHGILLIVDEVQTGMGRTGKWWGIQHWGVEPDMVCTAKGIASGMPLGAMIARKSVMNWPPGAHGNTYGGNPLSCSAALETIRLLDEGYIANSAAMGEYTLDALQEIAARHPSLGDARGKGLMIGAEFVKNKETKERGPDLRDAAVHHAFEHGLLLLGCGRNTVRFTPPLNVTQADIDEGLEIFEHAVTMAEKELL